jgi:hypothetical protein
MPFEKGKDSTKKAPSRLRPKRPLFGNLSDLWAVFFRVHSWAKQLKEGRVRSCTEIAKREGITPARVSQLWPLSEITRQEADEALAAGEGREISLRRLIRIARIKNLKSERPRSENSPQGN